MATGGWRSQDRNDEGYEDGDAELKRMFVIQEARGRGLARLILAALEDSARAAGRTRMVLETGVKQPEAIALYTSSGYELVKKFGLYRFDELSRCFGKPLALSGRRRRSPEEPAGRRDVDLRRLLTPPDAVRSLLGGDRGGLALPVSVDPVRRHESVRRSRR